MTLNSNEARLDNLRAAREQLLELLSGMDLLPGLEARIIRLVRSPGRLPPVGKPSRRPPKSPLGRCLWRIRTHRGLGGRRQHHPGTGELRPGPNLGRRRQVLHRHPGSPGSRRQAGISRGVSAGPLPDQRRRPDLHRWRVVGQHVRRPLERAPGTDQGPCETPWGCGLGRSPNRPPTSASSERLPGESPPFPPSSSAASPLFASPAASASG